MVQNAHPPLDNPQVRWAISNAIDRNAIAALAYEGATVPTWGIWPYLRREPALLRRDQRPARAVPGRKRSIRTRRRAMFTQAGVNAVDDDLKYVVNGDSNEDMKVAAGGVRPAARGRVQRRRPAAERAARCRTRFGAVTTTSRCNAFCPGYIAENLELFHSKNYVPLGQPAPWFERNSFRYSNPELDAHRRPDARRRRRRTWTR